MYLMLCCKQDKVLVNEITIKHDHDSAHSTKTALVPSRASSPWRQQQGQSICQESYFVNLVDQEERRLICFWDQRRHYLEAYLYPSP